MYRALVVDDVEAIRYSIAGQVDDSTAPVIVAGTAENGEKALEWLASCYTDICITDIRMPVVDGLELIKNIRQSYPWMASLIISSYDDFSYARASIQLEAVDYILKPVDEDNLDEALKKAVGKIEKERNSMAASLMLTHMSECSPLLEKWSDYIKGITADSREIAGDTVKKLSEIAGGSYFLMIALAEEWIGKVAHEMRLNKPDPVILNPKKSDFAMRILKNADAREWFVLESAKKLLHSIDVLRNAYEDAKGNQQSRIVDKIIKYINENYTRSDISIKELADHMLFSKNHIANLFKQETGMTIWNYIIDLRMKKAKELLEQTTEKTVEIAMRVGYYNYNHFSQLFKEYCGISAQEYRRKIRGK